MRTLIALVVALCLAGFFVRDQAPVHAQLDGRWFKLHAPAANTQATISQAAVATASHVVNCIAAKFSAGGTAPAAVTVTLTLRDGASGAGTILMQHQFSLPATAGADTAPLQLCGLNLRGSPNTAMTIEFTAAGGANTLESVFMNGYDN